MMDLQRRTERREKQLQRQNALAEAAVPPALDYLRGKEWLNYDWSKPADRARARFNMGLVTAAVNACRSVETGEQTELIAVRTLGEIPKALQEANG